MAIPESQLETWSHQGAVAGSCDTYNEVKKVLEASTVPYAMKDYKVFLQGSYGNDTNVYKESDVDVVIQLNQTFNSDTSALPPDQFVAWDKAYSSSGYNYYDFRKDVLKILTDRYGSDVKEGDKAISIAAIGNRRKADVITALQYRRYHKFNGVFDESYDVGICLYNKSGDRIANYPKQHSENMTAKHQLTARWLKPLVRIVKNMRNKLVDDGKIKSGVAPSYYIEGLLYNVPNDKFGTSYGDSVASAMNWILQADRGNFVCANEQYYLLWENTHTSWPRANCDQFLNALKSFWNNW
ncbi:MAG: nucleotidyltransferase [Terracidiphilus sp.]|jgi:hypothetical protein